MNKATTVTEVRIAQAHVFQMAKDQKGVDKQFEVTMLIDKTNAALMQQINGIMQAAAAEKWGTALPHNIKYAVKDSMVLTPNSGKTPATDYGYGDCFYVTAGTKFRPSVVKVINGQLQDLIDPNDPNGIYSGCYAKVMFGAYAYSVDGSNGVNLSLDAVCVTRDGEKMAGGPVDAKKVDWGLQGVTAAPEAAAAPQAAPTAAPIAPAAAVAGAPGLL